jgi:YceI-like domain
MTSTRSNRYRSARSFLAGRLILLAAFVTAIAGSALASDAPSWRVSRPDVRVICPLTVGGSFEAKTSSLAGVVAEAVAHPATLAGDLTVDLRTLDTGIEMRNDHLRREYLEVDRGDGFDKAVLSDLRLGDVDWESFQGRTPFTATLLLHGTRNKVQGRADIRRSGGVLLVEARFPVILADYGIPKPQYLGVGVKDEVEAKVTLELTPASTLGGTP